MCFHSGGYGSGTLLALPTSLVVYLMRFDVQELGRLDRRRFIGGLLASVAAAGVALPIGLSLKVVEPPMYFATFRMSFGPFPTYTIININGIEHTVKTCKHWFMDLPTTGREIVKRPDPTTEVNEQGDTLCPSME